MKELIIRKAEEKDLPAILQIEEQCFSTPWSYESLYHDILENKLACYLVGEMDGVVCGYMGIWNIVDEGHITNVAVAPMYRRRHIASMLLDEMLDICGKAGIKKFTLEVRYSNKAAQALYRGKGFTEAGLRKGYYEAEGEDAIIMWKGMEAE